MSEAQLKGAAKNLPEGGLIAIAWAGVGLAAFFVSARIYARIHETKRLGIDDYWMLLAFMFLAVNALLQTLQTHSSYYLVYAGARRVSHGAPLMAQGNVYVRYEFVIIGFFWTVLWCVKASFLALYWRLFEGFAQWRRQSSRSCRMPGHGFSLPSTAILQATTSNSVSDSCCCVSFG
jgi:hypothetical protein